MLAVIRVLVGPDMPVVLSLDMHANVFKRVGDLSTSITIYRTYPHLDMAETGARPAKAMHQMPFLNPLHAQFTGTAAMSGL